VFAPVNADGQEFFWEIGEAFEAASAQYGDVQITFTLRADMGDTPAGLRAELLGAHGSMWLGECFLGSPSNPDYQMVMWAPGCEDHLVPPVCPGAPKVVTVNVPVDAWNTSIWGTGVQMRLLATFSIFQDTWPCTDDDGEGDFSELSVTIAHSTPIETDVVYTAPASWRLRSYGKTFMGCAGKPRYKWGDFVPDAHTGTWLARVENGDQAGWDTERYETLSLGGLGSSPNEEIPDYAPGKHSVVFPVRGVVVGGRVLSVSGAGDCFHI
jgi:hypothetical protein